MSKIHISVAALFLWFPINLLAMESFLCSHYSGDLSFGTGPVLIEREESRISIFRASAGVAERDDWWSYDVLAESQEFGLQAVRSKPYSGDDTQIVVEYGGLLFITWNDSIVFVYAVAAQASLRKTETQVLTCERLEP